MSPRLQPRKTKKKTTQHQKQCPNKQKKLEKKTSYKDYTKPKQKKLQKKNKLQRLHGT